MPQDKKVTSYYLTQVLGYLSLSLSEFLFPPLLSDSLQLSYHNFTKYSLLEPFKYNTLLTNDHCSRQPTQKLWLQVVGVAISSVAKLHKQMGHLSDCSSLSSDKQAAEGTASDDVSSSQT
jgi:hypothetical protein